MGPWDRIIIGLFAVLLSACTSLPIQEMSDARQAVSAAQAAHAATYADARLRAALDLLDSAEGFLAVGDYKRSREAAVAAREEAVRARSEALQNQGETE